MAGPVTLHASTVALGDTAVLICGAAGRGKSALALQLMALGLVLVADDRTILQMERGRVMATCPAAISGLIEARGVGILSASPRAAAWVGLAVDLDQTETERLPPLRRIRLLGQDLPLLWQVPQAHFPAAIVQWLKAGRRD